MPDQFQAEELRAAAALKTDQKRHLGAQHDAAILRDLTSFKTAPNSKRL